MVENAPLPLPDTLAKANSGAPDQALRFPPTISSNRMTVGIFLNEGGDTLPLPKDPRNMTAPTIEVTRRSA
jgi:hypothetical protein